MTARVSWEKPHWPALILGLAFVVLVIWGGQKWYSNYRLYGNRPQSHQVQGQYRSLAPTGLQVVGVHILDKYPENSDFNHPQLIQVTITPDTKFLRTAFSTPTLKVGEAWNPTLLKSETSAGSIDDFKNKLDTTLVIRTANNIIGENIITASEIYYAFSNPQSKDTVKTFSISGQVVSVGVDNLSLETATSTVTIAITLNTVFTKLVKQADGSLKTIPAKRSDIKAGTNVVVLTSNNVFTDAYISAQQISVVGQ